jgi:hypothetical protein
MSATLTDGGILRSLGVMIERDEHGVARPVPAVVSTPIIYRRCGWCGVGLGVKPAGAESCAGFISDGMCPDCFAKVSRQIEERRAA